MRSEKKHKEHQNDQQHGGSDTPVQKSTAPIRSLQPPDSGINFTVQKKENKTGLPDNLKSGIESLAGMDLSDVKVHYNSAQPAQLNAHAYAQGNQIHVASGQEKHLAHEAWHVVQQKQGRVKPTKQLKSKVGVNDEPHLEKEADVMGMKAAQFHKSDRKEEKKCSCSLQLKTNGTPPLQLMKIYMTGFNDDAHLLVDTEKGIPESEALREWKLGDIQHAYDQLNAKQDRDPNERQLFLRLRMETNRRKRVTDNRTNAVGFAIGEHVRGQHARTPGVWKHWMEPEEKPHEFVDNQPLLTPKDASGGKKIHHMQYLLDDETGEEAIRNMVVIASHEHFKIQVSGVGAALYQLEQKLGADHWKYITPVVVKSEGSEWAEDSGEYMKGPFVGVPAEAGAKGGLQDAIRTERRQRGYEPKEDWGTRSLVIKRATNPANDVGSTVHEHNKQREKREEAEATGRGDRMAKFKSYMEGGNVLSGTDLKGKPFALVGKDTLAATRHLVDSNLTNPQIHEMVAKDLGLPPEHVVFVEQPGQFHLDMGIVVLGQGNVILNDSRQVLALMMHWLGQDKDLVLSKLQQINAKAKEQDEEFAPVTPEEAAAAFQSVGERLKRELTERSAFEERALADLEKAGIKVTRLPASFPPTPFTPEMNFLNGESGIGPDGRSFFITNGGDARAEDAVSTAYFTEIHSSLLARIYFTDAAKTEDSLRKGGGIGCRDKTECDK
jgi:hypothetical protein